MDAHRTYKDRLIFRITHRQSLFFRPGSSCSTSLEVRRHAEKWKIRKLRSYADPAARAPGGRRHKLADARRTAQKRLCRPKRNKKRPMHTVRVPHAVSATMLRRWGEEGRRGVGGVGGKRKRKRARRISTSMFPYQHPLARAAASFHVQRRVVLAHGHPVVVRPVQAFVAL